MSLLVRITGRLVLAAGLGMAAAFFVRWNQMP
jgi:hypothetical protein